MIIALATVIGFAAYHIIQIFIENDFKTDFVEVILYIAGILILIILIFVFSLLNGVERRKRDFKLAYYDKNLNVPNEMYFTEMFAEKIKKGAKGYIIIINIVRYKDTAAIGLEGQDYGRIIDGIIGEILVKSYPSKKNLTYFAHRYNGGFILYRDKIEYGELISEMALLRNRIKETITEANLNHASKLLLGVTYYEEGYDFFEAIKDAEMARLSDYAHASEDIIVYESSMKSELIQEIALSKELEEAIKNEQLEVYYQPKFDLRNNRFTSAEALVRWNHPTKGMIMPGTFIPLAEKTNQVIAIDRFVFKRVCENLAEWRKKGFRLMTISCNLSRNGLYKSDLIDFFKNNLKETKVSPLLLEIELTESAASKDMLFVTSIIKQIKNLNLKVAMDDFGTKYSSLAVLRKLPMDTLKIDKSFCDELEIDKKTRDIVSNTISLAKALEMLTVAEGIESANQVEILRQSGCDVIQGNFFSKAVCKDDFEKFIMDNPFERDKEGGKK